MIIPQIHTQPHNAQIVWLQGCDSVVSSVTTHHHADFCTKMPGPAACMDIHMHSDIK
jgi:hypothetical protein